MNILILEDEYAARKNLVAILREVAPECTIAGALESVKDALQWIRNNPAPDLAFFDIQLSDTIVFELFRQVKINFPVVFTTAYDRYAIQAFKVNSIDYILKPVSNKSVKQAFKQYRTLLNINQDIRSENMMRTLAEIRAAQPASYRKTFLVQSKDKLIPVGIAELAYFFIENGIVFGMSKAGKKFTLSHKLEDIYEQVDPAGFFRANRQYIISMDSVKEISPYFNERLLVKVVPPPPSPVIISKARAAKFKAWMNA
ncbi:MAG: LytTR family DNA-binding domain-containing protein [Bacteroidales bacterium]|nr:LytTR family DNA-binding domain-containing protein [Bacteroidales bacterium]